MDNQQELEKTLADLSATLDGIAEQIDYLERKWLTPREQFAKAAMQGLLSRQPDIAIPIEVTARLAFEYADAMIAISQTKSP